MHTCHISLQWDTEAYSDWYIPNFRMVCSSSKVNRLALLNFPVGSDWILRKAHITFKRPFLSDLTRILSKPVSLRCSTVKTNGGTLYGPKYFQVEAFIAVKWIVQFRCERLLSVTWPPLLFSFSWSRLRLIILTAEGNLLI